MSHLRRRSRCYAELTTKSAETDEVARATCLPRLRCAGSAALSRSRRKKAIAELIRDPCQLAFREHHVEKFFAVHGPPVFVLHLGNNFVTLHIYDITRRHVGQLAIQ